MALIFLHSIFPSPFPFFFFFCLRFFLLMSAVNPLRRDLFRASMLAGFGPEPCFGPLLSSVPADFRVIVFLCFRSLPTSPRPALVPFGYSCSMGGSDGLLSSKFLSDRVSRAVPPPVIASPFVKKGVAQLLPLHAPDGLFAHSFPCPHCRIPPL